MAVRSLPPVMVRLRQDSPWSAVPVAVTEVAMSMVTSLFSAEMPRWPPEAMSSVSLAAARVLPGQYSPTESPVISATAQSKVTALFSAEMPYWPPLLTR